MKKPVDKRDKYDIEKIRRAEEKRLRRQQRNLKLNKINLSKRNGDK